LSKLSLRRQSNCEDVGDPSTDDKASTSSKEMPHDVVEVTLKDIPLAPDGFVHNDEQTFTLAELDAQNSTAPDDEGETHFFIVY
jgi:hypothetical protein